MNEALSQIRPALSIAGSFLVVAGLIDMAGVNIPQLGDGLRVAVAGFLLKSI